MCDRYGDGTVYRGVESAPSSIKTLTEAERKLRYDEHEFKRMVERGTQAWANVPDATAWVENLRGQSEK